MSHDDKYVFAGDYKGIVHVYNLAEKKKEFTLDAYSHIGDMVYDMTVT
jgi:hypothetical protein